MLVDFHTEDRADLDLPTEGPSDDRAADPAAAVYRRRRIRRINVRSVLVVAAVFNVALGLAFFVAGWLVLHLAGDAGLFDSGSTAPGSNPDALDGPSLGQLMTAWAAIVAGWTVVMTLVWGLAAVVLNWSARLFGGIEVDVALPVLIEQQMGRDLEFVPDVVDAVPPVHPADQ